MTAVYLLHFQRPHQHAGHCPTCNLHIQTGEHDA